MKKIIYLFSIAFLMLQSCSSDGSSSSSDDSINPNGNVNYEFTVTFDGTTYKVKGNTAKDTGYKGPIVNKCIATDARYIYLSITDVTSHNYVSGKPFECILYVGSNFTSGINNMSVAIRIGNEYYNFVSYNNGLLPIEIKDLGTPLTGAIGTSNIIFGNTIKGNFTGRTAYTIPTSAGSPKIAHELIIDFIAVRQY